MSLVSLRDDSLRVILQLRTKTTAVNRNRADVKNVVSAAATTSWEAFTRGHDLSRHLSTVLVTAGQYVAARIG